MKKYYIITLTLFIFLFTFSLFTNKILADNGPKSVTGWAWSSNIGWIKFDTGVSNPVKINVQGNTGTFQGYAWSSNIGWISFNEDNGCPNGGTHCQAEVALNPPPSTNNGKVTGWARACAGTVKQGDSITSPIYPGDCSRSTSRSDGWDGWIQLSDTTQGNYTAKHPSPDQSGQGGITLDTTNGAFKGYAWGGDVVGWINFNTNMPVNCVGCVDGTSPGLTFNVFDSINGWTNETTISSGGNANIKWDMSNLSTYNCVASSPQGSFGALPSIIDSIQSETSGNGFVSFNYDLNLPSISNPDGTIYNSRLLRISCEKNGNVITEFIIINVLSTPVTIINSCTIPINASLCPGSTQNTTGYILNENCPTTNPVGACQYYCPSPFRINASRTACVKPGAIQEF